MQGNLLKTIAILLRKYRKGNSSSLGRGYMRSPRRLFLELGF